MEITKVVKSLIKRGWPNTFGNIVYLLKLKLFQPYFNFEGNLFAVLVWQAN